MTIYNVKKEILCYHVFLPGQREILSHYIFLFFWQEFQNRAGLCYFNVNNTFFHVDVISFYRLKALRVLTRDLSRVTQQISLLTIFVFYDKSSKSCEKDLSSC